MPQRAEILGDLHGGVASCFAAPPISLELQLLQGGDVELSRAGGLHAGYEGLGGGERPAAYMKTQMAIDYAEPEGGVAFISVNDQDKRAAP